MRIIFCNRWLLVFLLLASTCLLVTHARRGGGGSRGSSSSSSRGSSYSRPSYSRPAPAPAYRPPPAPAYRPPPAPAYRPPPAPAYRPPPAPAYRPPPAPAYKPPQAPAYKPPSAPSYRPSPRPAPKPAYRPSPKPAPRPQPPVAPKPSEPVVVRQPASNPNFKETDHKQGSAERQPAYNPNYKPDASAPAGPPPPYSPAGYPAPNAPVGPPPPYRPNQPGAFLVNPPPGVQPPPYPGQPGVRPPAYPGQSAPYPVQPGSQLHPSQPGGTRPYPVQPGYPGAYPSQPGVNPPYPVQPGYPGVYPNQPGVSRPYPVQPGYPGGFHQQPGINRPYPVQPGASYPYPGGYKPYPQQSLGANVWQPHHGMPAPAYMNYGGIPTGTNMYTKPHKKKGFIGSLMSAGKQKPIKPHKYHGSYPNPYGVGGMGHMEGGFLGKHGKSASMYTIFPYMAAKNAPKFSKPRFGFMPMYMPHTHYYGHYHHHHYHRHNDDDEREMDPEYAEYFDVYDDDYVGKCQQPIKKEHSEIKCKATFKETHCDARCKEGYRFPHNIEFATNKCWHVTGVWRPKKNFPDCKPVCENECLNGGQCVRPGVCKCTSDYRGSRCQFHFLKCDIMVLVKEEKVGWVCNHFKNESICKIRCKEPGQFESPPADEYKCTPDGIWKPDTLPHCVIKELPGKT